MVGGVGKSNRKSGISIYGEGREKRSGKAVLVYMDKERDMETGNNVFLIVE